MNGAIPWLFILFFLFEFDLWKSGMKRNLLLAYYILCNVVAHFRLDFKPLCIICT